MITNSVRRPSQESETCPVLFLEEERSRSDSEGNSLANLTQNVFQRVSSDVTFSAVSSQSIAGLEGKVQVISSANPIKLVEDYTDSDSESSIEIFIQSGVKFVATEVVEDSSTEEMPVKSLDQDLLDKVDAQRSLFPSSSMPEVKPAKEALRSIEEIEAWIKGYPEAPQASDIQKSNIEMTIQPGVKSVATEVVADSSTEEMSVKPLGQDNHRGIDERIDDFLENNPFTRFANWMLSFIPKFIIPSKLSVEEKKAIEEQKDYETFIARIKASDKISKEKIKQVESAKNHEQVLKKSFNTYQSLLRKNLRGYKGAAKDQKAFDRAIQIISSTHLK